VADADPITAAMFHAKLLAAGLQIGGTVRPSTVVQTPYGPRQDYLNPDDVVSAKIAYGHARLGWTDIYFDSSCRENAWVKPGDPVPFTATFYKPLLSRYPKVRIIPEYAPKSGMENLSGMRVQPWVRFTGDNALPLGQPGLIVCYPGFDLNRPTHKAKLVAGLKAGMDIYVECTHPWEVTEAKKYVQLWREAQAQ
jgi:hypothetical protein